MSYTETQDLPLEFVSRIVVAYVSGNIIPTSELPGLIRSVHDGLLHAEEVPVPLREPAVPVSRSVKPHYIVCLEDGKKVKMLKPHLRRSYNLSPEDYRKKWELPEDYPMVAPKYSERRRELAKTSGLGRKSGKKPKARKDGPPSLQGVSIEGSVFRSISAGAIASGVMRPTVKSRCESPVWPNWFFV
jgi:predicted transcriptional regulator